jgi:hypothetical protein
MEDLTKHAASVRALIGGVVAMFLCVLALAVALSAAQAGDRGMEDNTDRPGSDYARFNPPADPENCRLACMNDRGRCVSWTYVRPGVQEPQAVCYLKNAAPAATPNNCCVSGVLPGGRRTPEGRLVPESAPRETIRAGMENNTDRAGSDYARLNLPADPENCRLACMNDRGRCVSWTYVRPGVQEPGAVCYLKNAAPPPAPNNCCVSGVRPGRSPIR